MPKSIGRTCCRGWISCWFAWDPGIRRISTMLSDLWSVACTTKKSILLRSECSRIVLHGMIELIFGWIGRHGCVCSSHCWWTHGQQGKETTRQVYEPGFRELDMVLLLLKRRNPDLIEIIGGGERWQRRNKQGYIGDAGHRGRVGTTSYFDLIRGQCPYYGTVGIAECLFKRHISSIKGHYQHKICTTYCPYYRGSSLYPSACRENILRPT